MKIQFDSYCGIYCGACSTPGCKGCKIIDDTHWSPNCKFIKCAQDKGIEACPLCDEYPCEDIMKFDNDGYIHHKTVLQHGLRIKEIGIPAWLVEQKKRWSCNQCGRGYTWSEETCQSCGSKLFSVKKEFGVKSK
ncbi:DUF3795 domain-containing protein [Candidatus Poribacteria bacterium]|nr:DUF3795 domain-containing protein [Candidatus Poribacteria bacterium]